MSNKLESLPTKNTTKNTMVGDAPGKMPATTIRAIFIDIDGTLVGADNRVAPRVLTALDTARAKGCEIVLCTGRARHTTQPIAEQIGRSPGYAVTSNGGVAMHLGTNEILHRHLLPIPIALEVIQAVIEVGAEPYVYEDATSPDVEGARVLFHPDLPTGAFATTPRFRPHENITSTLPFTPVSISAYGTPERMRPLVARLTEMLPGNLSIIQSGSAHVWGVEIYAAGVSKQLGLETITRHLDIDRSEVMAIGDHMNDIEMIQWSGIGVAMGNALPEILAVADWITAPLWEDGVAIAIEKFV